VFGLDNVDKGVQHMMQRLGLLVCVNSYTCVVCTCVLVCMCGVCVRVCVCVCVCMMCLKASSVVLHHVHVGPEP
jgi:hypothetical protein